MIAALYAHFSIKCSSQCFVIQGTNLTISDSTHLLDHSFSLPDLLGQMFDSGNGCDFLIVVKSATGNRQEDGYLEMVETTICAHKTILSQFPLFNASEEITNITVDISQSCQPYFAAFIRYTETKMIRIASRCRVHINITQAFCMDVNRERNPQKNIFEKI